MTEYYVREVSMASRRQVLGKVLVWTNRKVKCGNLER